MLDSLSAYNTGPVNMARSLRLNPALELERAAPEATAPLDPATLPTVRDDGPPPGAPPQSGGGLQFAPFSTAAWVDFGSGMDVPGSAWDFGPNRADFQAASRAYEGVG